MAIVTVDGKQIEVADGSTVLQACEAAGAEIPRFCYHERLSIAGNCRMCLVKVEKMPKPVASCAQPINDGMNITTNSLEVKKMREGVMEFLLINHPLDCPICDQAGECDLQDQAMAYGKGNNRFHENKRAVEDKNMGPLVKTSMTRCIHCTRCVRFMEDVAGTNELGAVHRGEDMQITTYLEKNITSELSGNIIDLCPVGALTSKPYAFKARPWELVKTDSIDVMDAVGSNIRLDSRGPEVMRVLPRVHDDINEEWISDKTRFAYDGLNYQRLDTPMVRKDGKLVEASWEEALSQLAKALSSSDSNNVGAIAGDMVDVETMLAAKLFLKAYGSKSFDCRQDGSVLDAQDRSSYIFNTTISGIEKADFCLIVGSNPRHEAPILNARILKAIKNNGLKVALIGEPVDLGYEYKHIGENPWLLKQIADGQHPFNESLGGFSKPMLILGSGALAREDGDASLYYARKLAARYNFVQAGWNGFNVLQRAASRVGGLDVSFLPETGGKNTIEMITSDMDVLFLLGADELNLSKLKKSTTVVYIGHHGDVGATSADIILPAPSYTEKDGTFVNLEGRVQQANRAVLPKGEAKEEWRIFSVLAEVMGLDVKYKSLDDLRKLMVKQNTVFKHLDEVRTEKFDFDSGRAKDFMYDKFVNPISNFYMTDPISRNSRTMAECTQQFLKPKKKAA
jgi:NADH-quinone oxidoreductase subunit G